MTRPRRGPIRCIAGALLSLCIGPLAAAPSGEGWSQLDSEHFTVISQLDESATRAIGTDLERLRFALEQIFDRAAFDSPLPTFLFVFRDQGTFAPYSLGGGGEPGYFVPHIHANFAAVVGADEGSALPIVYRQYIHELVSDNVPALQTWFRHGLAELFSTFEADDQEAVVGLRGAADLGLDVGGSLPLAELLVLYDAPGGAPDAAAMKSSWGLVHYLLAGDSERFQKTRSWVRRGVEDPDLTESIADALGTELPALQQALDAYLGQPELPSHRIPVAGATTEATFHALDASEAIFHLGDLLIHTASDPARRAAAAEHFSRVMELAPESAEALGGAGLVRQGEGDLEGAEKAYRQALELVDDSFRLHFVYGDLELELLGKRRPTTALEETRLAAAIGAFERTTELNPAFGEGWARLGYAYNLQAKPAAGALPALERGYEMLPDRSDVAFNLLLGYARAGEREKAWELIDLLEARGGEATTLDQAREVAYQIDFQAAGALAREKRYDDAIGLFARIAAESASPELRQRASEAIPGIAVAAAPNRFAERYAEAVAAWRSGDLSLAAKRVESLADEAAPGLQTELTADLGQRAGGS